MACIKNLKVKAGEENIIKAAEVGALYIVPNSFPKDAIRPFIDEKRFIIEAPNGRWEFKLDDITYFEFDIENEKHIIHVVSRAEGGLKDAEIQ